MMHRWLVCETKSMRYGPRGGKPSDGDQSLVSKDTIYACSGGNRSSSCGRW